MMENIQTIGVDIGRGYVKGYTEVDGKEKKCMFKSIVALGREMDFKNYKEPIFIDSKIDETEYKDIFCGILAEEEGHTPVRNSLDSKTSDTVKKLLSALISKLAEKAVINLMFGVPKREFTKTNLREIQETYKGKEISVYNHITKENKKVLINNVSIFREADAALLYETTKNKINNTNDNVMVSVGFRTTEIGYYDNNLRFIDKKSKSFELGNKTVLEYVQNYHPRRSLEEIDSSNRYDELKNEGYKNLAENIYQQVEALLVNMDEINLYIAGGLVNNLKLNEKFIKVQDPQIITAKGLYLVATRMFN